MALPTDGKWITVNGTHIFIKNGQTAEDAFKATTGKSMSSSSKSSSKKEKSASEVVKDYESSKMKFEKDPHKILKTQKESILSTIGVDKSTLYGNGSTSNWDADFDLKKGATTDVTEINKNLYNSFKQAYKGQKGYEVEGASGKGVYVSKGNGKTFFVKVEANKNYKKGGDQGKYVITAYNSY